MSSQEKILVVDDNVAVRRLTREVLERAGYEVLEACDGVEALRKIEETMPDLVILDIEMPVMDGFAVVTQLRANPRFASLPVLAFTGDPLESDQKKLHQAGFNALLPKQISPSTLTTRIKQLLT